MRKPSLRELEARERNEAMESHRFRLEERGRRYGLNIKENMNIWKLAGKVQGHEEKLERPKLIERARSLGVHTNWFMSNAAISIACYDEERRKRLLRQYGYTKGES